MPDPQAVNSMFGRIARRYDLANRLISGGVDVWWRKRLVRAVQEVKPADVLDLATGSGDVAFALAAKLPRNTAITGMDFCQPMLAEAERKKQERQGPPNVAFRQGDGLNLPIKDNSFDAITLSFGLRNMADRHRALQEIGRTLRPGGRLCLLEFSQPKAWFRPLYYFYLKFFLPPIAGLLTGDRQAYSYLCGSIESFPTHDAMAAEIVSAGLKMVRTERLTFGIVALHLASRP